MSLLRGGHTMSSRVEVWHGGQPSGYVLEVVSGSVQIDAERPVRSNLTATLIDPTGRLSTGDVEDILDPYECEIAPYRGVRVFTTDIGYILTPNSGFGVQAFGTSGFGGGEQTITANRNFTDELAPLGVFGLTNRSVSDGPDGLTIQITGQDRAMGYQVPMANALAIPGGTPVEAAIVRLLSAVNPRLSVEAYATGETCGPLLFEPDIDVWAEARELAASVGASLFHDRTGQCVLAPSGPTSREPVFSWREGDGLLLSLDRAEDSDTIRNVVVAESLTGAIRVVVEDDDPTSPTYARGRYGRRVTTIKNQHYQSVAQAQKAAQARLAYELGRSETVGFSAVPNPGVDVGDVVTVHRPRAGLSDRAFVVASLDIPLVVEGAMTVGCRRSVIAQDGRVFDLDELEVAA